MKIPPLSPVFLIKPEMAAFDDVLLYKTKQKAMLRTSLNTNLTDFREMEFEIRKQAPVDTDHSAQALLKDHYARNILLSSGRPTYSNLAIPLKHRRDASKDRPQRKYLRPKPLKSISSVLSLTEGCQTARVSLQIASDVYLSPEPRMSLQEERSDGILGLQEHIEFTQGKLLQQRRVLLGSRAEVVRGLQSCVQTLNSVRKAETHGLLPKALVEYKKKKALLRAQKEGEKGTQPLHMKRDIIKEYRSALLRKALAHGTDREMRYVYTLGTIDATNT